ncbi:MAG: DUF1294 domain-containing protein [Planctomycetota bacterium]
MNKRSKREFSSIVLWAVGIWLVILLMPIIVYAAYLKYWPNFWLLVYSAVTWLMSPVAFVTYWIDKRRAQQDKFRVPEKTLHLLAALGGWPGAIIAQQWLRHKSQKLSFRMTLGAIVILHLALLVLLWWWSAK